MTTPSPGIALLGDAEVGDVVGGERADLLERALVEQHREPLARGDLALRVLLGDPFRAAARSARSRISRRRPRWSLMLCLPGRTPS